MDPQAELIAVLNTLTDLQMTLTVVRDADDALRSSKTPAARLAYGTLPETIAKLEKYLNQLT
ncbi:hypothetical protein GGP41_009493 [Bipolaris sorokiniana]|uniref:Uncharacterized protein n=1 Tax=Cochliobolus sativus TaxID=45130 RepID=A0A8H5Z8W8_COCSA|nr:hypothetical protein GGP41_009493 [Bipolaris sorokiniana]